MTASVKLIALALLSFWIGTTISQIMSPTEDYKRPTGHQHLFEKIHSMLRKINSCGYRNSNGLVAKSVETPHNVAKFGEFPWMVLISNANAAYISGGSLIAPNVVLTNAHNVIGKIPEKLSVRAGEWDRESELEPWRHQNAFVKEIICHEDYESRPLHNDIALLILEKSFTLMPNVQPICLPGINTDLDENNCVSSGWGQDKLSGIGADQQILEKVELSVVPHSTCEAQLRTNLFGYFFQLHPSFTCAGGELGNDKCMRDGGSPLICPDRKHERYYQVGIAAWDPGCSTKNVSGLYSNVSYLRNWIITKLSQKGVDLLYFTA